MKLLPILFFLPLMAWMRPAAHPDRPFLEISPQMAGLINDFRSVKPKMFTGRTIRDYSLGEYMGAGTTSDSLGVVFTDATGLMCNNGTGTPGTPSLIGTSTKMRVAINSLHCASWLDYSGHPWFGGQQSGIPYITAGNVYDGIQDSAGSSTHFFDIMSSGWNFQDGEEGFFVARDNIDSSVWICGDLQNGIRGNGTASADLMKWVKVPIPAGDKAIQIYSSFTVFVLCDTVSASGTVLGQRLITWSLSGAHASSLGYGSPGFGAAASTIGTYNVPHEILIAGQHVHNIRMLAGGLECNYALFDSLGVQRVYAWGTYGWRMCHTATVGADPLNTPTDITAKIVTSTVSAIGPIDTIVTDMASTHMLVGSGSTRVLVGWGSSEQGTLGNGAQINMATYSSPYNEGGSDESSGQVVQFTPTIICLGKTDWKTLLNGGYYCYYNMAQDAAGWTFWGRFKIYVAPMGVHPQDFAVSHLSASQTSGWQFPNVTRCWEAFANTAAPSTSQGCANACVAGPVSSVDCSSITVTCSSIHAGLTVTSSGTQVYLNGTSSTYAGVRLMHAKFYIDGVAAPGVMDNPVNKTDTANGVALGSHTAKVVVQGDFWEADSTTFSFTVTAGTQTAFYLSNSPTASDANTGADTAHSLASFAKAWSLVSAGDTIYIRGGDIFTQTWYFNKSGTQTSPIVITSYGTGRYKLSGLYTLTGGTSMGNNIYEFYVPAMTTRTNMLILNGVPQRAGSYPDTGVLHYTSISGTTLNYSSTTFPFSYAGATVVTYSDFHIRDTANASAITSTSLTLSVAPTGTGARAYGYFFENHPNTLLTTTRIGAWYKKPSVDSVQIYLPGGLGSNILQIPILDTLLYFSSDSNIEVDNGRFDGSNLYSAFFNNATRIRFNSDLFHYGANNGFLGNNCPYLGGTNDTLKGFQNNGGLISGSSSMHHNFTGLYLDSIGLWVGMGQGGSTGTSSYTGWSDAFGFDVFDHFTAKHIGYAGLYLAGDSNRVTYPLIDSFGMVKMDVGGLYTWAPGFAANNDSVSNGIFTQGQANWSGLVPDTTDGSFGVYGDGHSKGWTFVNCTSAYNASGGGLFHGSNMSISGGHWYGNGYCQICGIEFPGITLTGLSVTGATIGLATSGQIGILFSTPLTDLLTLGTADHNFLAGPVGSSTPFFTKSSTDAGTHRTLPSWATNTGNDTHSTYQPGSLLFVYNATTSSANFPLWTKHQEIKTGTVDATSVTVPAFSANLLFVWRLGYNVKHRSSKLFFN